MKKNNLTLTVVMNSTANYGESLGNISSIQKVRINGKTYSARSMESMKYALMNKAGFYDELESEAYKSVAIKLVDEEHNIRNCRELEAGYMCVGNGIKRNSSFRITPAIAITPFSGDIQFHNNLGLATKVAKTEGFNVQEKSKDAGLMPYNYEFEKCTRIYSITIFLDEIGEDENFNISLSNEEKAQRVIDILNAIKDLEMEVKGSLDNAEPLFIIGGLSERKSHVFENLVKIEDNNVVISDELKEKCEEGYHAGIMSCAFNNTEDVKNKLNATSVNKFFELLEKEVNEYFK